MNESGDIPAIAESMHRSVSDSAIFLLSDPTLDPLFWPAERIGEPSAWWLHVPFAHWIVWAARPSVLVELGTHAGVSYSAFCQAVRRARLPTRCHAVDTWRGDEHAGRYDESVYHQFKGFHDQHFGEFSTLIRSTFDEALQFIEDRSIDFLHIDGLHTYEAVKHDFDSWLGKLSKSAVVVMHDVNERSGDFGVWRLWAELCEQYPSFTFLHGHGLGVLAVGEQAPAAVLELCRLRDPTQIATIRDRFAGLGGRWFAETRERMAGQRMHELAVQAGQNQARAAAEAGQLHTELGQLKTALAHTSSELDGAREALAAALVEAEQAGDALGEARSERDTLLVTAEGLRRSSSQTQAEREELATRLEEVRRALINAEAGAAKRTIAEKALRASAEQNAALDQALIETRAQLSALAEAKDRIEQSTLWRASTPLRRAGTGLPASVRRAVRGGMKLAWWTARLQLPRKLKERRRLIEEYERLSVSVQAPAMELPATDLPVTNLPVTGAPALLPAETGVELAPPEAPSGKPRLVYISGEAETPGNTYRVQRYVAAAEGVGARASSIRMEEIEDNLELIESATILVLWRTVWSQSVALAIEAARRSGARIVYDLDDLMVDPGLARTEVIDGIRSQSLTEEMVGAHYARVRQAVDAVDVCFATTEELALHLRLTGKPTFVLPNGFDQDTHDLSRAAAWRWRREREDEFIRIGYAGGSRTHQRDFGLAVEPLARVLRENPNCRLVLFRTPDGITPLIDVEEYPALAGLEQQIEWRPLQKLRTLPTELARFDINLAPLEFGNPFCECKSELKFFEAALADVPTIASPTGPFRRAIEHGHTGFLAATAEDWYDALSRLVADPELRRRVARAAYDASLGRFGPIQRQLNFRRVIAQVQGGAARADAFALSAHASARPVAWPKIFDSDLIFERDRGGLARVSVVVPLYNYEQYVVEALDSVHAQTLETLDLVIVDGNSTDNSLAVAREWAEEHADRFNRIVLLKNRENIGLAFCRNSGFDAAQTKYVMLLDADNKLLPECCARLLETIERTGAAFAYGSIQRFGGMTNQISDRPWDPQLLVPGNYLDAMALVSKEAWAVVGGVDHVRFGWEDFDFWCRMAEYGLEGQWYPDLVAVYRTHHVSMMHTQTLAGQNYKSLNEEFKRRHPWVWLYDYHSRITLPKPDPRLRAPSQQSRTDKLLPILRCPETGSRLTWNEDRSALISVCGARVWRLVGDRPVLAANLADAPIYADADISNELPEEALALIRDTDGFVLNLGGGRSRERFGHVVEVGSAIFPQTDLLADAQVLPFYDETFAAVIVTDGFEQYREPHKVAAELRRVLKPGGRILIRTAFLQPQHERPGQFYHSSRAGVEQWFSGFEAEALEVPESLCANHAVAALASEAEAALRVDVSAEAALAFKEAPIGKLVEIWRDPAERTDPLWTNFEKLSPPRQEAMAAGFQFLGRKPFDLPDLGKKRKLPKS